MTSMRRSWPNLLRSLPLRKASRQTSTSVLTPTCVPDVKTIRDNGHVPLLGAGRGNWRLSWHFPNVHAFSRAMCACRATPASNQKERAPPRRNTVSVERVERIHRRSLLRQCRLARRSDRQSILWSNEELGPSHNRMAAAASAPRCCRKRKAHRWRELHRQPRRDRQFSATDLKASRPKPASCSVEAPF